MPPGTGKSQVPHTTLGCHSAPVDSISSMRLKKVIFLPHPQRRARLLNPTHRPRGMTEVGPCMPRRGDLRCQQGGTADQSRCTQDWRSPQKDERLLSYHIPFMLIKRSFFVVIVVVLTFFKA